MSERCTWEADRIQPCPFCGNDGADGEIPLVCDVEETTFWIVCENCGGSGPGVELVDGKAGAVREWNGERDEVQEQPAQA